jgi:hypothetical protein
MRARVKKNELTPISPNFSPDGTEYDALFLAMAHHQLGHAEEARRWLRLGTAAEPLATQTPSAPGGTSWITRLEFEILQREASGMIEPIHP